MSHKNLTRRDFFKTSALCSTAWATGCQSPRTAQAKPNTRPNVLIIVCDQMNIDAISAYRRLYSDKAWGAHWVQTPNLDRLVNEGVSFMESHSTNPVCSPARSSLFTGRYSTETAVTYNNIGIDKNVPNMGQWFSDNSNYDTYYCGKWHAGGRWNYPNTSGSRKIPGFNCLPVGNGNTGDIIDYQVSGTVDAFLRNYQEKNPFLMVAGLMNPHDICYWIPVLCGHLATPGEDRFGHGDKLPPLPPNHKPKFTEPVGKPMGGWSDLHWRNYLYDYYRMVEKLDGDIGRILNAVRSRSDDTLVVFTSDHGEGAARHGRVQKWHPYDQSVKVPLILWAPGRIQENVINTDHLVSGVDIMSTVCDYAGIPAPPHAQGLSLRPLLNGDSPAAWRDYVAVELQHTTRVVRSARYKYVKKYRFSRQQDTPYLLPDGSPTKHLPGKTDQFQTEGAGLLFDMQNDPWETQNLWADSRYTNILDTHDQMLKDWENRLIPGTHYDRN